ncbi:hypothetical protein [Ammoniphilus resinae]|uniref:hypothetical protein n=1 Tax=Ammoniphilus resinae TaxID=861532 RepID=UPI001AE67F78|nr:hypothetical protein [Ammoniphilus resinae]
MFANYVEYAFFRKRFSCPLGLLLLFANYDAQDVQTSALRQDVAFLAEDPL